MFIGKSSMSKFCWHRSALTGAGSVRTLLSDGDQGLSRHGALPGRNPLATSHQMSRPCTPTWIATRSTMRALAYFGVLVHSACRRANSPPRGLAHLVLSHVVAVTLGEPVDTRLGLREQCPIPRRAFAPPLRVSATSKRRLSSSRSTESPPAHRISR